MYIVCTMLGVTNAFSSPLSSRPQTPQRSAVGHLSLYPKTIIGHCRKMREVDTAVIDNVFYHHRRREWLREPAKRNGGQGWLHRMHWKLQ